MKEVSVLLNRLLFAPVNVMEGYLVKYGEQKFYSKSLTRIQEIMEDLLVYKQNGLNSRPWNCMHVESS